MTRHFFLAALCSCSQAQLLVDFNSTTQNGGPHNQSGYQAFSAPHEGGTPPAGQSYSAFGTNVTVTPAWPNTSAASVRQFIDRGNNNDANWGTTDLDLLTDWMGSDSRSNNGGNGTFNGVTGSPTYLTLTLSNLPAGAYTWTSFHHDTENIHSNFQIEISPNGGSTFSDISGPNGNGSFPGTDSSPGGDPESAQIYSDATDKNDLPSTATFDFTALSGQNLVIRFSPHSTGDVHNDFFVINGFELESDNGGGGGDAPTDIQLSSLEIASTAAIGATVGQLTSTDPTPEDTFTYSLVSGDGDTNNSLFEISGQNLITQSDLNTIPGGTFLSVRMRSTDSTNEFFEKSFQIQIVADSDNDGLDDNWELLFFDNLTIATGAGNNDTDALTNSQEQALGSDPTLADTDGDGLDDDIETNTGIFSSPADSGSNPILADSDGDGLLDGAEVGSANGSITDPNKADSDDDGFNDRVEIQNNTDPNNVGDFPPGLLPVQINEILTSNESINDDGNGSREDWIELFNPNPSSINLTGYHLTDNAESLTKWTFPNVTIGANDYLLVFASGNDANDANGNPHTNFNLSSNGEFLALVKPDGTSIDDQFAPTFPEQFSDISYGRPVGGGALVYFATPTPGSANSTGSPGVVRDTNFSIDRGFYDTPFNLEITSDTTGALIRYTLDGSLPSLSNGLSYTGPIPISTTTNVRAIAYREDLNFLPTNVDTHTYIFVDDVAQQTAAPAGWPADWGFDGEVNAIIPSDYEMDPRVVDDDANLRDPGYSIRDALLDIPSVSITMRQQDIVKSEAEKTGGDTTSLYGTPRQRIEKVCSMEYIHPDGTPGFQEDCKIETHGNSSRRPFRMQKHSLRVTFSTNVGIGKLRHDLFPDSPVDTFNKLVLRACFTDSWALNSWSTSRYRPNDSQYFRDVWMKDSMTAMGHASGQGNFVHLYLNGVYFGLHNLAERIEDDWYSDHIGGEKEDWKINKDLETAIPEWNSMLSNLTNWETAQTRIDVGNYADYMLLHFFADAEDWPHHNGYAAANFASGDGRFRFQVWDQEIALDHYSRNRYDDGRGGGAPFQRLRQLEDFRMLFADRTYKHMFDGGALTVEKAGERYLKWANEIDKAIVAESARWGDTQANTQFGNTPGSSNDPDASNYPPLLNNPAYFTREQHWVVERDHIVNNYFSVLHDVEDSRSIIRELRSENLYPSIDPPLFSQLGGVVPLEFPLSLSAPDGSVVYTTDGSDPRLPGGAINPTAGEFASSVVVPVLPFLESNWKYLDNAIAQSSSNIVVGHPSYSSSDWKHPDFNDTAWPGGISPFAGSSATSVNGFRENTIVGSIANTVLNTRIDGVSTPTMYFRNTFNITGANEYISLSGTAVRDDGIIIYLNGREIFRDDFWGNQTIDYSDYVGSSQDETEVLEFTYTLNPGDLVEGNNVIAIEVHNSSSNSGDNGVALKLDAITAAESGNTINLVETGTVKARVRLLNGEWSALREANFIVGTPAAAGFLVVSEIMYNPQGPDEDLEFIELLNISPNVPVDMTNVAFTDGILYEFPTGFILPPLTHVVVVKNQSAFAAAYDTAGLVIAPGNFESNLSNKGEGITLTGIDGLIRSFNYSDDGDAGWPTGPDGFGPSLVLNFPLDDPDHALPASWRPSASPSGSPGTGDVPPLPENPDEDLDGDGLTALAEFFFGTSDNTRNLSPVSLTTTPEGYLFSFPRVSFPVGLTWVIQTSDDMENWQTASGPEAARDSELIGSGRIQESAYLSPDQVKKFIRVKIEIAL